MGKLGSNGRLTTLSTLLRFIKCALDKDGVKSDATFEGWVPDKRGKGKGKAIDVSLNTVCPDGWLIGTSDWGMGDFDDAWDISRLDRGGMDDQDGQNDTLLVGLLSVTRGLTVQELYLQLVPLLQSTFLEAAPTAFGPSSAPASTLEIPIQLSLITASLTISLCRPILAAAPRSEARIAVSDFLRRMSPYFPFKAQSGPSPTGLTPALELDIIYANLALLLAPPTPDLLLPKNNRKEWGWRERIKAVEEAWKGMRQVAETAKGKKSGGAEGWAIDEVAEWVIDTLVSPYPRSQSYPLTYQAVKKDALAPPLTLTTYAALVPIIWSLLVQPPSSPPSDDDTPTAVGVAFFSHLLRQGSSSAIRAQGDRFVIDLMAVHEQRHPKLPFFISTSSPIRFLATEWIVNVPKTLWELGTKDETATETLLKFLLDLALRGSESVQAPFSLYSGIVSFTA